MTLQGKGFFIWQIRNCEDGDASAIANLAFQAGLTHVLIKIADATYAYNIDLDTGVDLVPPVAQALRAYGILVYGWHYVYGNDPIGEADIAIQRVEELDLDGYVIDAEAPYKADGKELAADYFMTRLRSGLPDLPIGLSSYRYPTYHPQIPWQVFLEKCDFNMPQHYWIDAHNPGEQLVRSLEEFMALDPFRPLMPTGAAFIEGGWAPTTDDITEFLATAQDLHLTAANFWEWSNCRRNLPDIWDIIKDYQWSTGTLDIAQRYIAALNTHDPQQVVALYRHNAIHVTSERTLQGETEILDWYDRRLNWSATSSAGTVENGNDVIGLMSDEIVYHFTFFSIT
jgi:hypothetical protein